MKIKPEYTMKYVALRTGLKPYLIRSWESRHKAICPQRSANQRRCFTDAEIERLSLLKQAVDQGHTISTVARMGNDDLTNLLRQDADEFDSDASAADGSPAEPADHESTVASILDQALSHVRHLNASALEHLLNDAAVRMSRHAFLQWVVLPLFERIGELWRVGEMKIINEHMASLVVRSILWDMLRSVDISRAAPRIVVATPVGHWHEFGALASALAASESGWRVSYFGPNLPCEEVAYAIKRLKARALALSLCHGLHDNRLMPELKKLRRLVGSELVIFIGGPGAGAVHEMKETIDAVIGIDLNEFRQRLERLAQKR